MIKCNLAVLLAERNLKITQVAAATGLSRTTLTYIANNYSQGIQLDTLNKLCIYLQVTPDHFFTYLPFDISKSYNVHIRSNTHIDPIMIKFKFITKSKIEETFVYAILDADFFEFPSEDEEDTMKRGATRMNITIQLPSPEKIMHEGTPNATPCNNDILIKYFRLIPATFRKDIEAEMLGDIIDMLSHIKIKNENRSLTWPAQLL